MRGIDRRVLGALAAVVTVATVVPGAYAVAAPGYGTIELAGWYDDNRDGVRDAAEEPVGRFSHGVEATGADGLPYFPQPDNTITLPAGTYEVAAPGYEATTPATVTVTVTEGDRAPVEFGVANRSVSGTVWEDTNLDGVRQDGEPPMSGVEVRSFDGRGVSGGDGRYTVGHLGVGEDVFVPGTGDGKGLLLAPPDQHEGSLAFPGDQERTDSPTDSDFRVPNLDQPAVAGPVDGHSVDMGVAPGPYDQSVTMRPDRDISGLHVGDEFVAVVTVRGVGGAPARREIDVTSGGGFDPPVGLTVAAADGAGWPVEIGQGDKLATFRPPAALPVGAEHTVRVRIRVDEVPPSEQKSSVGAVLNGRDSDGPDETYLSPAVVG